MKPLYALPDYEVIKDLIPGIAYSYLRGQDAIARIRALPGLVPVGIDPETATGGGGKVLWADLGQHPFREWQFSYTVQHLAKKGLIGESFTTDFSILHNEEILADPIEPLGFIFHVGRCGSTLMAKALARLPHNLVISEGGPLQKGFWEVVTGNWSREAVPTPENLSAFRNLVLAMTRRRQRSVQRNAFVKLISWNTLYLDFIKAAFPQTAALFLYRDPVEVIASVQRGTTSILLAKGHPQGGFLTKRPWQQTVAMEIYPYLATCIANYLHTALLAGERVKAVNYLDITPTNFPCILRTGLGYVPQKDELGTMLEQFRYHAKDDSDSAMFVSDIVEKQSAIAPADRAVIAAICKGFVEALDEAPSNLFFHSR
jgi:hypothetical protein